MRKFANKFLRSGKAVILGLLILVSGGITTIPLVNANVTYAPSVPWLVVPLAIYVWLFIRYIGGSGWPRSTGGYRRQHLRNASLPFHSWVWALLAGLFFIAFLFAINAVLSRFIVLEYAIPDQLLRLPQISLLSTLLMISIAAGLVEESAFRGYMQTELEEHFGVAIALFVTSAVFVATHFTGLSPMSMTRMAFIGLSSLFYGVITHLVKSIRPAIVIHAVGDSLSFGLLWWNQYYGHSTNLPRQIDGAFWINTFLSVAFLTLLIWSLLKLKATTIGNMDHTHG
jgi:membrane protease YdiL (CAAX protease family)